MLDYRGGRVVDFYDVACVRVRVRVPYNIWTEYGPKHFFADLIAPCICYIQALLQKWKNGAVDKRCEVSSECGYIFLAHES